MGTNSYLGSELTNFNGLDVEFPKTSECRSFFHINIILKPDTINSDSSVTNCRQDKIIKNCRYDKENFIINWNLIFMNMMIQNIDEILIATSNKGKLREVQSSLSSLNLRLRNLSEFPSLIEPEETGVTFAENAILKARYYAQRTKLWTLADDSGLEVDALGGAPGVFSARYAGVGVSDSKRIDRLLSELTNVPKEKRNARFICALAFCNPEAELIKLLNGTCEGCIAFAPKGTNGFGYDPAFLPDGYNQTFGELSHEIKQKISHRANALKLFSSFLTDFLSTRT